MPVTLAKANVMAEQAKISKEVPAPKQEQPQKIPQALPIEMLQKQDGDRRPSHSRRNSTSQIPRPVQTVSTLDGKPLFSQLKKSIQRRRLEKFHSIPSLTR